VKAKRVEHLRMKIAVESCEIVAQMLYPYDLPYDAISEQGGVIVSYNEAQEPVSIEFLNASKRQLFNPSETNLVISR